MNSKNLSVLVAPRDGPPYQELLYRGIELAGVQVHYAEGPTPSQTLNILLAPGMLAWHRARGSQILHIHWTFQFSLPWARRKLWARYAMQWWFGAYLRTARALGYSVVWTAHDLVPHDQIFANDSRAQDLLISRAKAVIALSETTAIKLHELGASRVSVIPFGSYAEPYPVTLTREEARASFGFSEDDFVLALIGRMEKYKGADLLLRSAAQLPVSSRVKLLLAGSCSDKSYRAELDRLVDEVNTRVDAHFLWVPDDDLARYLQAADAAVFPFREITNSGSIRLAQSFGLPVIIPNLPFLDDIPTDTAIRFDDDSDALLVAILRAEQLPEVEYSKMRQAALEWATGVSWADISRRTIEVYESARLR